MIKFMFKVATLLAFASGLAWAAFHFGFVKITVQTPWSQETTLHVA